MNCVIYFGVLLCVKSSFVILSSTTHCVEQIDNILHDQNNPIIPERQTKEQRVKEAKEAAIIFGNQSLSIEKLSEVEKVEETEFENVFELLPKRYSSLVDSIGTFIEKFQEITKNDKNINKNVSKNVKKIVKKLKTFDENELLDLRICKQIMNNQYYPVPHDWVLKCLKLNFEFKKCDPDNTGRIAIGDFQNAINKVFVNDLVKKHIFKSLSGVKDVQDICYEAWLLNIRKNLYESQFGLHCLGMKCLTCMA
ncbi:uncharacterized protein LOC126909159 [Daktulosphaira vitifoliae]|uniref:uncharacterized protein LOC126909159 n=1 Tax=Daktulosphaira vitifoliae TaxID=58002 RepID=UPI0021A9C8CD|nr:uncharacterized protein LOC126909159 [Daktulosphaira vitifoliae]